MMKTIYQNVTNNERGFRTVFGIGILTAISAGLIASTTAIFVISMIAIYQVMTAIIGIDPVYALWNSYSKSSATRHNKLVTN